MLMLASQRSPIKSTEYIHTTETIHSPFTKSCLFEWQSDTGQHILKKKGFILILLEGQIDRKKQRQGGRSSICYFAPQAVAMTGAEPI